MGHAPDSVRERWLAGILALLGAIDLLALVAVVAPASAIGWLHGQLGLGEFPTAPIALYLARSASALYALHGALTLYLASDVRRYLPLIRCFAAAAVLHGVAMLAIDTLAGMPLWWLALEGPVFAATGVAVLALARGLTETTR